MAERLEDKAKDLAEARGLLLGPPPKGKGKGVPQLGDPDGMESGWAKRYKLWFETCQGPVTKSTLASCALASLM